jgi:small subunit ribosomal protein S18
MAQEIVTLECTEAKALGKPASRYMTSRNKKSPRTPNRLEKKKYNPFLRRHTLHRETTKPSMQPKTPKRRSAFRRANRPMPRRRIDIALEAIDYKNPDLLKKFVSESGKILPRRVTGMPAYMHRKITREIKRSRSALLMK